MIQRTESEIKAYVDGYKACYKNFCECLKGRKSVIDAVKKMEIYLAVVTGVVDERREDAEIH